MFVKNVAVAAFHFSLVNVSDGTPKTGATPTVYITKDVGSQGTVAGTVVETAHGEYYVPLSDSEMNAAVIGLTIIASGALPVHFTIKTVAINVDDTVRAGLTALPDVASGSAGAIPTTGSGANQIAVDGSGGLHASKIGGSTQAATNLAAVMGDLNNGTVDDSTFSPTNSGAAVFETSFTVDDNLFADQNLKWNSGPNDGITSRIASYAYSGNGKAKLTLSAALPHTPTNADAFTIIGRTN